MIRYALRCGVGHEFDGWFRNSGDFEVQKADGALICPVCGDRQVEKAIMAPSIRRGASQRDPVDALRRAIQESHDYVGPDFASEVRRMQAGEQPERPIYGEATMEDAKSLAEDGAPVAPIPFPIGPPKTRLN